MILPTPFFIKTPLLVIVFIGFWYGFTSAQTFVSTIPEKRNVVLEEFTGIYCIYCPDGHRLAQELKDANPEDVALINLHVSSYADPGTSGDPDFRTPFGTGIQNQADISGYPAGTINRKDFTYLGFAQDSGTAMSRAKWVDAAPIILADSSYVNVSAEASLHINTRELTVVVQAYYTDDGAPINYVKVALLQNNVPGPQYGAVYNPTQILPNGDYNHMHMLRHLLAGNTIIGATSGTLYSDTLTYTIPDDLNGVDYELFELSVVVFISEPGAEIITGSEATMTYIAPGLSLIDLEASTNMTMPTTYCDNIVIPEITITNNSTIAVDTFEVGYTLDSNTPVTLDTNLDALSSITISFPSITLSSGSHTIYYNVNTDNTATFVDIVSGNNNANSEKINTLSSTAFASSHTEGFESYSAGTEAPNNAILDNADGGSCGVLDKNNAPPNWELGGFGKSSKSFRMRLLSWEAGYEAKLVFEKIDLSASTGNGLRFSYAYVQRYAGDNDKLEVLVSTDCGITWNKVFNEWGDGLATSLPFSNNHFYPDSSEWDSVNIDMSAFDGESMVMIAFKGTCDDGNNLYLDDIELSNNVDLSNPYIAIEETGDNVYGIKTYPIPINEHGFLELCLGRSAKITIAIYDILGQRAGTVISGNYSAGTHYFELQTSGLNKGIYFIRILDEGGKIYAEKLIKN